MPSDNEYRLLRQSLFERFASASTVPSESPVVKVVTPNKHARMFSVHSCCAMR